MSIKNNRLEIVYDIPTKYIPSFKNVLIKRLKTLGIISNIVNADAKRIVFSEIDKNKLFVSDVQNKIIIGGIKKKTKRLTQIQSEFVRDSLFALAKFIKAEVILDGKVIKINEWPVAKNWPIKETL